MRALVYYIPTKNRLSVLKQMFINNSSLQKFSNKMNPQEFFNLALYFCIPILFFVTPLSSSAKSIFLGLSVAFIFLSNKHRQELFSLLANKYCLSAILLFILAVIGCTYSPATFAEKTYVLEKWSKLLYLPCLVVGLNNPKIRKLSIHAFLLAMLITCFYSFYLKYLYLTQNKEIIADSVFRNHIITGLMMSFAAYLSSTFFIKSKNISRIFYLLATILYSYQILFINESRTGYALYMLLMTLVILQNCNKRKAFLGFLSIGVVFSACCYMSTPLWDRIKLAHTEWHTFQENKNTSIGFRVQFHDFAKQLFTRSPIIGSGTGSFTYAFRTENPVPAWTSMPEHSGRLLEPHSQYWLVGSEFGSLGVILFLLFYCELFIRIYKLDTMRPMALALFIILCVGNFTDSLLFYSGPGYFFILFFALALSEGINASVVIKSLQKAIDKKANIAITAGR